MRRHVELSPLAGPGTAMPPYDHPISALIINARISPSNFRRLAAV
jgi:hypothetical protein